MSIIEQLLGPAFTPAQNAGGPASPYGVMPRHLSIPNMGGSVPLAGTPVNFPTYTPPNPINVAPAVTSRLAPLATSARSSFSSSPLAKLGRVAKGGSRLGRIGPAAIGGLTAGPLGSAIGGQSPDTPGFDRRDVGQAVSGALTGASLGSFGGWPGALAGGLVTGLGNALNVFDAFGGPKTPAVNTDPKRIGKQLDYALADAGITGATKDAIKKSTLDQLELATTDAEREQILATADQTIMQQAMVQEQSTQQLAHSLALQAQAAKIFEPYAEANQRNADMARVLFESGSQNLPESQRYLAAQFSLNAQQQADAQTQQMMTTAMARPRIDALIAQQQQIEGVAAQIVQGLMAPQISAAVGGGGGDQQMVEQLLAGL